MTVRQKVLKLVYPLFRKLSAAKGVNAGISQNTGGIIPPMSFYSLQAMLPNGEEFQFESLRGRKVLIINLASNCGYTAQYAELEQLHKTNDNLVILGFPANDFGKQEPGTDEEIAGFCKINYGVSFPLFKKCSVIKPAQHPVYAWLSGKSKNGWNERQPSWNFFKYLVDETGVLQFVYEPFVSPLNEAVLAAVQGSSGAIAV